MKTSGRFRAVALALGIRMPEIKISKPPKTRQPSKTRNGNTCSGAARLKRIATKRNMAKARASKR